MEFDDKDIFKAIYFRIIAHLKQNKSFTFELTNVNINNIAIFNNICDELLIQNETYKLTISVNKTIVNPFLNTDYLHGIHNLIKELRMFNDDIGDNGCFKLIEFLKTNDKIQEINLSKNNLSKIQYK